MSSLTKLDRFGSQKSSQSYIFCFNQLIRKQIKLKDTMKSQLMEADHEATQTVLFRVWVAKCSGPSICESNWFTANLKTLSVMSELTFMKEFIQV